MNIAFEAKRAYTNGTGLGHYSRTLISSLATAFHQNEYFLCTPKLTNRFNTDGFDNVHVVLPRHFPSNLFTAAWRSSWVKKDLKKLDIDVYHGLSHEIPVGIQSTGIKSTVTIHDLIFERYPKQFNPIDVQIYRKKFSYACHNADRVIAISQQTKQDIIDYYQVPEEKIDICYQSCNPSFAVEISEMEKARIREEYQLPERFFLYVGSIIERKNLLTICKALQLLKDKPDLPPLVVIGEGKEYKQQVQQYISENGLQQQVIFMADKPVVKDKPSYRNAADFPAIYQQAICMIYPSIFEGFGIPVLEALFSNLPVITSNVSCLPEAGGDAAFYVNPYSAEALANAMWQLATNDGLRQEMMVKGQLHAQNFTPEKCAEAVMQVYLRL
ncbi:Glycosyltransferase involved in cell wall bisynthesis [Filimonas lacunae]|uniref:Glycosyltransferase involved in cell wall bisynthesis n=1 Tax=Filimonas lacunae TaxID=477680 RepID=A0A173MK87_9BACT|nr:glycosyltransferase family 1 protein [Filimonas lacunae]BAV08053.1 glycosyl transferase, group 1 family protein [Filimonas lacunae]SIT08628.1 Glycosyltransferase involved in cell wall bisynthesis [Filimonas lacunae]